MPEYQYLTQLLAQYSAIMYQINKSKSIETNINHDPINLTGT